ncbi:MAG: hypothetical protein ABI699_13750 [Caldimonas sp.]
MNAASPSAAASVKRTMSPRLLRLQSGVLIVLGALLAVGIAVLLVNLLPTLLHPGVEVGGSTFGGTSDQAGKLIVLLAWVAILGLVFLAIGVRQLMIGRTSRLTWLALLLFPVTIGLAWSTSASFG